MSARGLVIRGAAVLVVIAGAGLLVASWRSSEGAVVSGRVERRDSDGHLLAKDDLATTPTVALTLTTRW